MIEYVEKYVNLFSGGLEVMHSNISIDQHTGWANIR